MKAVVRSVADLMTRSIAILIGAASAFAIVATASHVASLEATVGRLSAELAEPPPPPAPAPAPKCLVPRAPAFRPADGAKSFDELAAAVAEAAAPAARAEAIRALGREGGIDATFLLDDLLGSADSAVASVAAEALATIATDDSLSLLARRLDEGSYEAQTAAAHGLAFRGDHAAVLLLTGFIERHAPTGDAGVAIAALGRLGSDEAVEALSDLVYFGRSATRDLAADALASSTAGVSVLLDATDAGLERRVRTVAVRALRRAADPRADTALVRLAGDRDPQTRLAALEALGSRHAPQTLAPLLGAARLGSGPDQAAAITALGQRNDAPALDALGQLLRELPGPLQLDVVLAIGSMTVPGGCDVLVDVVDHGTGGAAYQALQTVALRCPERLAVRDPRTTDSLTASVIITALGNLGTDDARRRLEALAAGDLPILALAAIDVLGSLGLDASFPALRSLVRGAPAEIASAAVRALGGVIELGGSERGAIAARLRSGRWSLDYLPMGWEEDPTLVRSVSELATTAPLRATRLAAVNALSWSYSSETRDFIRSIARDEQDRYGAKSTAVVRLAVAGDVETLVALRQKAGAGDATAIDVLASVSDPALASLALPLFGSANEAVATAAIGSVSVPRAPAQVTAALEAVARSGTGAAVTAAMALGAVGTEASRRAALGLAVSGTPAVREAALRSITTELAPEVALPVLRQALLAPEAAIGSAAFDALIGFSGGRDEVERAFIAARDPALRARLGEMIRATCPEQYERHQAEIDTIAPQGIKDE